jgi:hypothetical protein
MTSVGKGADEKKGGKEPEEIYFEITPDERAVVRAI